MEKSKLGSGEAVQALGLLGPSSPSPLGIWGLGFWCCAEFPEGADSPLAMEFEQQKPPQILSQFKASLIFSLVRLRWFLQSRMMELSSGAELLPRRSPHSGHL